MSVNDHPLTLELTSLRSAFDKYQHAAHVSALQLQRARLDATDAFGRVKQLEAENDVLRREVAFLRTNVEPIQASRQTTELSLALRRLSDKLSFTEQSLLEKISECLQATSALNKIKIELKAAQSHIDSDQALIREYASKEIDLNMRCKAAQEETKMAMSVINDYASLVRSLQRDIALAKSVRKDGAIVSPTVSENDSSTAIFESFQNSRNSIHQLLQEANSETTSLHVEISRLHNDLSAVRTDLEAEREVSQIDRQRLAQALLEIERFKTDDMAAERMVSRYMRFSQSSIDALQTAVSSLKNRHAATLATLSTTSEMLSKALEEERVRVFQMRDILDELTEGISRETYGRRREVSLRLRSMAREERLLENLKGWIRHAEEQYSKVTSENSTDQSLASLLLSTYNMMVDEGRNILASSSYSGTKGSDSDSLSKILLMEHLCSCLRSELQIETEKRLELVRILANYHVPTPPTPTLPGEEPTVPSSPLPLEISSGDSNPSPRDQVVELESIRKDPPKLIQVPDQALGHGTDETPVVISEKVEEELRPVRLSEERPVIESIWEELQKGFTDCHLALEQLKNLLLDKSRVLESQSPLLLNVVVRLDDYCEDARVELEIHIADLERIRKGVETVHKFHNPSDAAAPSESLFGRSAVNGSETFRTKLNDLEHDIVRIKEALYDPELPMVATVPKPKAWPFSSSPSDPIPPSFGTIITSPKPRRVYSLAGFTSSHESLSSPKDPYAHLNLRIPMPSQHPPWELAPQRSPLDPKSNQLRITRSSSSLYRLGLQSSSHAFNDGIPKSWESSVESVSLGKESLHVDVE